VIQLWRQPMLLVSNPLSGLRTVTAGVNDLSVTRR
jgi:hypothetical protein